MKFYKKDEECKSFSSECLNVTTYFSESGSRQIDLGYLNLEEERYYEQSKEILNKVKKFGMAAKGNLTKFYTLENKLKEIASNCKMT